MVIFRRMWVHPYYRSETISSSLPKYHSCFQRGSTPCRLWRSTRYPNSVISTFQTLKNSVNTETFNIWLHGWSDDRRRYALLSGGQSLYIYFIESETILKRKAKRVEQERIRVESKTNPPKMVKHALEETESGFGCELSTFYDVCQEYEWWEDDHS